MGLISWLANKLSGKPIPLSGEAEYAEYIDEYAGVVGELCFRELALYTAINLIANAVSKCEFKTYAGGKEVKGREHYLWNFEPNKNQSSSQFIHKWITQLYRKNECLIIEQNGQLVVADSFNRAPYVLYEDMFDGVTVGDFTFSRRFAQSEVLYFKLGERDMQKVVAALYGTYSKLLAYTMKAYQRSRGTKGILKYESLPSNEREEKVFNALINEKIGKWLNGDAAALPLGMGLEWKELQHKTYSNESTRDIRAMVDDISDFTAKAFGIPPALMRGDVQGTKDALEQFLTFCIDPLCDMLQEEINRKRNGYDGVSKGTYLQIDTSTIKHADLLSVATAIDKLIGSGAFCINDIRIACGQPVIDEPWAWQHYITKNYATVEDALTAMGGGE